MTAQEHEHMMLQTALDHAWAWYTARLNQYLHLLNAALLATAIFSAAYVGALTADLLTVAAGVASVACAASLSVVYAGRLIQSRADLAQAALTEIQDRLAGRTGIDAMRLFAAGASPGLRSRHIADTVLAAATIAWFAAAVYPFLP